MGIIKYGNFLVMYLIIYPSLLLFQVLIYII